MMTDGSRISSFAARMFLCSGTFSNGSIGSGTFHRTEEQMRNLFAASHARAARTNVRSIADRMPMVSVDDLGTLSEKRMNSNG